MYVYMLHTWGLLSKAGSCFWGVKILRKEDSPSEIVPRMR